MSEAEPTIDVLVHHLINKLAIMANYADFLSHSGLTQDQREMVDEIKKAAKAAIDLHGEIERRLGPT
jgi:light-regulated signal transduction histidine kinase (bacteriophytochrome)